MHLLPAILLLPLASAATLTSLTSSGTDSTTATTATTPTTLLTKTVTKTVTCVVGYYFAPCPRDPTRYCCVLITGPTPLPRA